MSRPALKCRKASPGKPSLNLHTTPSPSAPLPFSTCANVHTPHVHFPPTPTMVTSTHVVGAYDRAPIRVSANSCAIPERGGRIIGACDDEDEEVDWQPSSSPSSSGRDYFHPRSFEACDKPGTPLCYTIQPVPIPNCIPELCSESDDSGSDGPMVSTPPDLSAGAALASIAIYTSQVPYTSADTINTKNAFVPHAPPVPPKVIARRRRPGSSNGGNRSCSPAGRTIRSRRSSLASGFCANNLDGCLGGF